MCCPEIGNFLSKKGLEVSAEGKRRDERRGITGVCEGVENIEEDLGFMAVYSY